MSINKVLEKSTIYTGIIVTGLIIDLAIVNGIRDYELSRLGSKTPETRTLMENYKSLNLDSEKITSKSNLANLR